MKMGHFGTNRTAKLRYKLEFKNLLRALSKRNKNNKTLQNLLLRCLGHFND